MLVQDLDPALISRFATSVRFDLPDAPTRAQILGQYAQHLSEEELSALAADTPGCSGRDLKAICETAERHWAAKVRVERQTK